MVNSPAGNVPVTRALVRHICQIRWEDLPIAIQERTVDLLLDHVAVTLAGATQPWSAMVRRNAEDEGGETQSTVYGYGAMPARAAALVNGCASHAIEFDDTHDESLGHPGAVVMTTAMAMAESLNSSGTDMLRAIVAGYEAQCRIGSATGRQVIEAGFHPTATAGVFGAAAAAGCLLGLNAEQLESAFGIALSTSSGTMQFSEDPLNTMVKRLHAALPATNGLLAAQLASRGFTGPSMSVEGAFGYARLFGSGAPLDRVVQDLGLVWEIGRISVKLYPCCKQFHALIDSILACRRKVNFSVDDVVEVETLGPQSMFDTHMERRPESTMAAQYSLPFTTAVALALDPSDPASFDQSHRERADLLRVVDKVQTRVDPRLQAVYPRKFAGGVRIRLQDGRELIESVLDSRSSPERPISRGDVLVKFKTLTRRLLTEERSAQLVDAVLVQPRGGNARQLGAALRGTLDNVPTERAV
jgi:2-methylcitrate dehydratase PrpD